MIIEIPKGYVFTKKEDIIAFEENGILKMYARYLRFEDLMYDITYETKGRERCYYCGRKIMPNKITLDHIYPRSLGGPTIPQNLIPACKNCNEKKGNMTPEQHKIYQRFQGLPQQREFKQDFENFRTFQEKWCHILPEEWISSSKISGLLLPIDLQDTSTDKYRKTDEFYARTKQFPKPIIVDCNGFVLDGFTEVLYAKNNVITEIPTIILENVEVIFKWPKEG